MKRERFKIELKKLFILNIFSKFFIHIFRYGYSLLYIYITYIYKNIAASHHIPLNILISDELGSSLFGAILPSNNPISIVARVRHVVDLPGNIITYMKNAVVYWDAGQHSTAGIAA